MSGRLHPNARTTPRIRGELQASGESVAVLARRYNISEATVRRWRARTTTSDGSHVRHDLGQSTSPEVEALIGELRRTARLTLDDITEVLRRCVDARLTRSSVWRAMVRIGVSGPLAPPEPRAKAGEFAAEAPGFVHIDLKYLRKLGSTPEFAFVAIERTTRFVHVELLPDRGRGTVAAALSRFLAASPLKVRTILTDNGTEFTDRFRQGDRTGRARPSGSHPFDAICRANGIVHRLTRPYSPQTNGMAERFNRRLASALRDLPPARDNIRTGTKFLTRDDRRAFILGFVHAYNRTRLRCLDWKSPIEILNNLPEPYTYRLSVQASVTARHSPCQ